MKAYFLHPDSIRELFNSVAPRYDLLNHLLILRRDVYWRTRAARELNGVDGWILDIATGTGDVAIEIIRQGKGKRRVLGLDFSEPMLRKAYEKLLKKRLLSAINVNLADALFLPFQDNTFNASVIAFGLRNILKKEQALAEMARVTKKGGKVIILEFTFPERGPMRRLYPSYFMKILPWVGGLISGDKGAYAYLPQSVFHFQSSEKYRELMKGAGLHNVTSSGLTFGIASIITGIKKDP
jgi:demethylmenaquinone methyltransferase/2-methoxy-6-polyprenyl-1,4-benzoquinol methylase